MKNTTSSIEKFIETLEPEELLFFAKYGGELASFASLGNPESETGVPIMGILMLGLKNYKYFILAMLSHLSSYYEADHKADPNFNCEGIKNTLIEFLKENKTINDEINDHIYSSVLEFTENKKKN